MLQAVVSRSVDMLLYCANFTGIVLYVYLQHWARISWRGSAILPSPATVGGQLTSTIFPPPVYLTPPMKGFPLEFGIGVRGPECFYDVAIRWSKKFSDRFSRFDTIPAVTDSHPATQPPSHRATLL